LRGLEYYFHGTKEANAQARQLWEKAVALDPQYAEAYASLSGTYYVEWLWRWSEDPQILEQALALAQRAVALDDSLPSAHGQLGMVYALKQQYDQALPEEERAVTLDPNNAESYVRKAEALDWAGRPEEALRAMMQAMRLNPYYPPWYLNDLGWTYELMGQYGESIATLKETVSRSPNFMAAYNILAYSYWMQWLSQQSPAAQTLEPALTAVQQALTLNDSYHWNHIVLGLISLYQHQYDLAQTETKRAVALMPTQAWSYTALAEVLSCIGQTEEALAAITEAQSLKPAVVDDHLGAVGTAYAVAGHYKEARAALQRFLIRYPNILPAHLMLAAVNSELGQVAEAQKETAEVLRLNPNFSLAVHKQRMPIKDPAVLERHIAALRKAGLK
jgi:tetratricopeptide (TPR) repeat protein